MSRIIQISLLVMILLLAAGWFSDLFAQCPMCKTNLEGAMKVEENSVGAGINAGIMYLFTAPFLAAFTIGFLWFKESRKSK